ncbi:MAG: hypothetical protein ABSG67_01380 [Thermoguttaceae bacterium]|jgi:hypothetical protein
MREVTQEEMDVIGVRHGIHPRYRREFMKLANEGRIDDRQFSTRLHACLNYKAACRDLMELLAQPTQHLFDYRQFQSVEAL